MSFRIVQVHTDHNCDKDESNIKKIQLSDGTEETVTQVVNFIDASLEYYFTSHEGNRTEVEAVHLTHHDPYIRAKKSHKTSDSLLSLPQF